MGTKAKRWFLTSFCLLVVTCNLPVKAYAGDKDVAHAQVWTVSISSSTVGLDISSKGTATTDCSVRGKAGVTSSSIKASLQKKKAGSWSTVKSWESTGERSSSLCKTYSVSRGTYRVKAIVKAGNESKTVISTEKQY